MNEKDLRVIKTKESIHDALLYWLAREPFEKLTVRRITTQARINRSTFYKYYVDKFDLLDRYLEWVLEDFISHMNTDFIKAPRKEISNSLYSSYFEKILAFFRDNSERYGILWRAGIDRNIYQEMVSILQKNLLRIIPTDPLFDVRRQEYAVLYSYLFANSCMVTIRWWLEQCPQMALQDINRLMKNNMEQGFFQTYRTAIEKS